MLPLFAVTQKLFDVIEPFLRAESEVAAPFQSTTQNGTS
jgi:hypothetical protein